MQLSEKTQELKAKDIIVVAIQTSEIEQKQLNDWIKSQNISLPVGTIKTDTKQISLIWGIKFMPWLILTNNKHIITAEGFTVNELEDIIKSVVAH